MMLTTMFHLAWQYGIQNPLFWLFVSVACIYVGSYYMLIAGIYGIPAANLTLPTVRIAFSVTIFELITLLIRDITRLELSFIAFAYDYVTIFVPPNFLKLADGQINFIVLMIFFSTLVFFTVIHLLTQWFYVRAKDLGSVIGKIIFLPMIVFVSFTLAFILSGYLYRQIG